MGGTPCTGVLVRTSVNIKSGATDKISQFINALVVLLVVLVFMPVFVYTPLPCIAAILVTSSCRLVPIGVMQQLWREDPAELVILFITATICVLFDGAFGLMVGAVISIMRTAIKSQ
jgi:MFS superfamily sulfate permease-like transporter